jgi:ATP-dependent helicase/nuclease subunit A
VLAHPPGWDQLAALEQRFLDAEANRLLYVAATRAGLKLVISQRDGADNDKNPWRLFDVHLQAANELTDPGTITLEPGVEVAIDPSQWQSEVAAIERRWQAIEQPTYAVQAIKESVITGGPKPHGAEEGGAEWGEVLHTLLEAAIKQPQSDLRSLALSALEIQQLPISLVEDVVATVERVTASDVWQRARESEHCMTEVPLALLVPAEQSPTGLPTVRRGVIDLVFRQPTGWVIVDYKSERVDVSAVAALVTYYKPQVEAYAKAWEEVVGQPVVESGLYFTHTGTYVMIS